MATIELGLISKALERTQGVVAHAAQLLGLRRTTLVEKLTASSASRLNSPADAGQPGSAPLRRRAFGHVRIQHLLEFTIIPNEFCAGAPYTLALQ